MTPKLPGLLVRYIQQKRCVVFVGAGLSAGAGLPTWKGLLLKGIDELVGSLPEGESHQEELRNLVEYGKLLEVAEFCKDKLGAAYHQFLTDQVRGDQAQVPAAHDVLMHLPFSAWVTTNYDKLLERAYSHRKGGFPKTLTHMDTEALGRLLFDGGEFILKAHGDIDRPETVVLTSRDYSEIIHANPAFNEAFTGLLLTKALFFVGYSLSDPDFRLLMDRQLTHFKGFVPERYALMTGVGPVEQDVLWRTARIRIISYENQSKQHAEVLQFLEALKAAVLAVPAPQAGGVKMGIPAPAPAASAPAVRSHNVSGPPQRAPATGFLSGVLEALSFSADAEDAPAPTATKMAVAPGSAPPAQSAPAAAGPVHPPSPQPKPPVPQSTPTEPTVLAIKAGLGRQLRFQLLRQGEVVAEGSVDSFAFNVAMPPPQASERGKRAQLPSTAYARLTQLLEKHCPQKVLDALAERGPSAQEPLVLSVNTLLPFAWELLPIQGQPLCLQRPLVRAPVGVSTKARGTPQTRLVPRILFIEGGGSAQGDGPRELERLVQQYRGVQGFFSCTVLQGGDATFARIMAELDAELPDLLHYTGDVGQMDGEPTLRLPDGMGLSAEALRSVLSKGRLPFLVMNAPSSAFALAPSHFFEEREGFMDLATEMGVGAFVGTFDIPGARAGTAFMVELHRALAMGFPAAAAVLQARKETRKQFPDDPTALQYVLSGDGDLQLWDSKREDTEDDAARNS
ncbi:MAG: SIR2 family protein [Hyalangium sp.]|uniref:SIR2 family protein n=1 Tax=Hyalangium sp. TaxID=2028555 RepID=UPI00389A82FB